MYDRVSLLRESRSAWTFGRGAGPERQQSGLVGAGSEHICAEMSSVSVTSAGVARMKNGGSY